MSQTTLAEKVGVTFQQLRKYENAPTACGVASIIEPLAVWLLLSCHMIFIFVTEGRAKAPPPH
ncbi:helix-turn-helix domain-containing protein [Rhizobium sp. BK512]|uniref:helix-turn-helix domain-containing protein n=1 Tax=Rhizobium sp. BK512 TaxID=2587010 RepID=UPI001FEFD0FB